MPVDPMVPQLAPELTPMRRYFLDALSVLALLLAHGIVFALFWRWSVRKGRASLRLLAISFAVVIGIREEWVLYGTILLAAITLAGILSWPLTSPRFYKKLGMKW